MKKKEERIQLFRKEKVGKRQKIWGLTKELKTCFRSRNKMKNLFQIAGP